MLVERLKAYLEALVDSKDQSKITLSSIGHCKRQLAYRYHGFKGEAIDYRARNVFELGTLLHTHIRRHIRKALKGSCYRLIGFPKEIKTSIFVGSVEVPGHVDGVLRHDPMCYKLDHESVLLEIKTLNERAYREFCRSASLGFEYCRQIDAYLAGTGMAKCLILGYNKNTSEISECWYTRSPEELGARITAVKEVFDSKSPEAVGREFEPDNEGRLPWQCGYCPFWKMCWANSGPKEVGRNKVEVNFSSRA